MESKDVGDYLRNLSKEALKEAFLDDLFCSDYPGSDTPQTREAFYLGVEAILNLLNIHMESVYDLQNRP